MKYTVKFLQIARDDLTEVRAYLSQFYPGTAGRFLTELRKQVELLKTNPLICEQYHDDPFYRSMVVGDYLVFYHVDDGNGIVEIHRILHGSRDIKRYI